MSSITKKTIKPETIVTIVSLIAAGLITYFMAIPQAANLKTKTIELGQKKAQVAALDQEITTLRELASTLPQYAHELELLAIAFPKKEQVVEAMVQASALAQKASMSVTSLAPSKVVGGSLPVTFTMKGSYESLTNFFREINANLRPALVQTISILAGGAKEGGTLTVNVGSSFEFNATAATAVNPVGAAGAAGAVGGSGAAGAAVGGSGVAPVANEPLPSKK